MRKLILWSPAQLDIAEAATWYEHQRPGLGLRFLQDLDAVMKRMRDAPLQFPVVHPRIRRALLKQFPYSVYFLIGDDSVEVVAVLHQRRHPDHWKGRL